MQKAAAVIFIYGPCLRPLHYRKAKDGRPIYSMQTRRIGGMQAYNICFKMFFNGNLWSHNNHFRWSLCTNVFASITTTSCFGKTANSVSERRLTSNTTVTVKGRDIWRKKLQKNDKRRPTSAYAETGSRNMAKTEQTNCAHVTQCRQGRGLPPYQVVFWSIQPFDYNRHGPKSGGGAVALSVADLVSI